MGGSDGQGVNNEAGLTPREWEVLYWLAQGKRNAEIAVILECKTGTVIKHISRIFAKIGVETRVAAANWFRDFRGGGRRMA